jgi:hypothetical protein
MSHVAHLMSRGLIVRVHERDNRVKSSTKDASFVVLTMEASFARSSGSYIKHCGSTQSLCSVLNRSHVSDVYFERVS